jgi:hypothetical protein
MRGDDFWQIDFKARRVLNPPICKTQIPPSPPCFMQETVVTFCAQIAKNVSNFAAILNGQSAQLVTYLLTRFCYHAQNAAALVNI